MANLVICERQELVDIADAIRANTSTIGQMSLNDMVGAINNIKNSDSDSSGGEEWIGDGNTHIWITLAEGRTSPMLGVGVKGTVTVDWGDGSAPDMLTGTSTTNVVYTPNHEYNKAGDYVITLSVDGQFQFFGARSTNDLVHILRYSSEADTRNLTYQNAVRKVELGDGVTGIGNYAFYQCYGLSSVYISNSVTSIGTYAFYSCSLTNVVIPDSVTFVSSYAFANCDGLSSVYIPDSVTGGVYNGLFSSCYSLTSVVIPNSVTSIGSSAFNNCYALANICIPGSVSSIASSAFSGCYGMSYCDFTKHTVVPTLSATNAFNKISADFQIRVPAALYDEWKAATNWSTYADYIVGV